MNHFFIRKNRAQIIQDSFETNERQRLNIQELFPISTVDLYEEKEHFCKGSCKMALQPNFFRLDTLCLNARGPQIYEVEDLYFTSKMSFPNSTVRCNQIRKTLKIETFREAIQLLS